MWRSSPNTWANCHCSWKFHCLSLSCVHFISFVFEKLKKPYLEGKEFTTHSPHPPPTPTRGCIRKQTSSRHHIRAQSAAYSDLKKNHPLTDPWLQPSTQRIRAQHELGRANPATCLRDVQAKEIFWTQSITARGYHNLQEPFLLRHGSQHASNLPGL